MKLQLDNALRFKRFYNIFNEKEYFNYLNYDNDSKNILYKPQSQILSRINSRAISYSRIDYHSELNSMPCIGSLRTNGFEFCSEIVNNTSCKMIIESIKSCKEFEYGKGNIKQSILQCLNDNNVIEKTLRVCSEKSGWDLIVWKIVAEKKTFERNSLSDIWHYDTHYDPCLLKAIIYLNSYDEHKSCTGVCDINTSNEITSLSTYGSLIPQRDNFTKLISKVPGYLKKDSDNPVHSLFKPKNSGEMLIFFPAKVLHRGFLPHVDSRYTVTLSLMPLSPSLLKDINYRLKMSNSIINIDIKQELNDDVSPYLEEDLY